MKYFLTLFMLIYGYSSIAQATFILSSVPEYTPEDEVIYLAGDINGWDPGSPDYAFTKNDGGLWQIDIESQPQGSTIDFKFTRGSWNSVEKGEQGEEIANRQYAFSDIADTVYYEVLNWADNSGGGNSTAADNVSVIYDDFPMPQFDRTRRIWLYLPPDYETSNKSYPVIYMHDGQNLFDNFTSYAGEWEVDETLNAMYVDGINVPIIVGIDNGGAYRIEEYTPWTNDEYGGGLGDKYIDFIVNNLKPVIDENYRTIPDRENTAIFGSSLGGLISHYGALKHQDVFSKAGLFSPSYWFSDSVWVFTNQYPKEYDMKFYQTMGSEEGQQNINLLFAMQDTLYSNGFTTDEIITIEVAGASHNEAFWREHFGEAYMWLFSEYVNDIEAKELIDFSISPNPVKSIVKIIMPAKTHYDSIYVFDNMGSMVMKYVRNDDDTYDVNNLAPGLYHLSLKIDGRFFTESFVKN